VVEAFIPAEASIMPSGGAGGDACHGAVVSSSKAAQLAVQDEELRHGGQRVEVAGVLWVGGLPVGFATEEKVRGRFEQFGEIERIIVCERPHPLPPRRGPAPTPSHGVTPGPRSHTQRLGHIASQSRSFSPLHARVQATS
jgi:hypothetical protein